MRSGLFLIVCLCAVPSVAFAQENDGDLRLMHEPHSWVDVPDAFDGEDPFDVYASIRYIHRREWGTIQREPGTRSLMGEDPNRLSQLWENVAQHEWVQNILELGLDIGIFRDLAVFGRMPIIMSDDRGFSLVNGVGADSPLVTAADTIDD